MCSTTVKPQPLRMLCTLQQNRLFSYPPIIIGKYLIAIGNLANYFLFILSYPASPVQSLNTKEAIVNSTWSCGHSKVAYALMSLHLRIILICI
jgi:hypothetical protein